MASSDFDRLDSRKNVETLQIVGGLGKKRPCACGILSGLSHAIDTLNFAVLSPLLLRTVNTNSI